MAVFFPKALGYRAFTERAIDSLLVLLITALVFLMQIPVFLNFLRQDRHEHRQHTLSVYSHRLHGDCHLWHCRTHPAHYLLKKLAIYNKVKATLRGLWQGSHLAEGCQERTALHRLHPGHLAELFPALLSHLPML